jgi:glycosyltransferase involved in cell wall biosynthesis
VTPRILFSDHSGALGGAELYLLDVIRHYPDATVVTFEEGAFPRRLRAEGVRVKVLDVSTGLLQVKKQSGLLSLLRAVPGLITTVRDLTRLARAHDLVYLNSQKALFPGALAGRLAGVPVLWNLHDILTADHFSTFTRQAAVWWGNSFVDRVVVNSEGTRDAFVACGGKRRLTELVYNGIDAAAFDSVDAATVQTLRHRLCPEETPCVGVFSRLSPWKGQHVLLDALTHLPEVHAVLVGDALFAGDESYAAALRTQVRALDLEDRVHFLGFRSDIPALMQAMDVVVHTATSPEPFGRVIVEGLLAHRPVVATNAGGAREILEDGRSGRLIPPNDPVALARALRELFENPAAAAAMAEQGRQMARQRFSIESMQQALDQHLAALLNRNAVDDRTSPPVAQP